MTTKILALTDALGYLVRFVLLPGQRHDLQGVEELLEGVDLQALLADKAFDADWLKQRLLAQGCQVVIAQKTNRRMRLPLKSGVLSFVQNVDKELRNGGKASTCGIHAGI